MGTRIETPQGLLVHDRRISLENLTAQDGTARASAYTQAEPGPGYSVAGSSVAKVRPQVHAAQTEELDVRVARGGILGKADGAGFVYRKDGEDAAAWRSWNLPNVVQAFQVLEYESGVSTWDDIAVVVIPDTQKVLAIARDSAASGISNNLFCWVLDPATRTWGAKTTVGRMGITAINHRIVATYIEESKRIVVWSCANGTSGTSFYSDDGGTTWAEYASNYFDVQPDIDGRAALEQDGNGNLYLVIADGTDVLAYYSSDQGHTFTQVDDDGLGWDRPAMCRTVSGDILLAYTRSGAVYSRLVTSVFQAPDVGAEVTIAAGHREVVVSAETSGAIWAHAVNNAQVGISVLYTQDYGVTWTNTANNLWKTYQAVNPDSHVSNLRAVHAFGEAIIVCNPDVPTSTTGGSLVALQAGGWSNLEHEVRADYTTSRWQDRSAWGSGTAAVWHCLELPQNVGWVNTGTAPTLGADGWNYSTAAASAYSSYTRTYGAPANLGWVFEVRVNSGGALATLECGVRIIRQDGSNRTTVEIRADTTGFRLYDAEAAAAIATVTADMTVHRQIFVYYSSLTGVAVWHRLPSESTWTLADVSTLTTAASASTDEVCRVGHIASGTADSHWRWLAFSAVKVIRHSLVATSYYNAFRWGKNLGSTPYALRDEGDTYYRTRLSAAGGPARLAEDFAVTPRYRYGLDRLFPQTSPAPKQAWRSSSAGSTVDLVWDLGANSRFQPGWLLALAVRGTSIPRLIEVGTMADGGGSFDLRGTYDGATGFTSLTYALSGNLLSPGTATATAGRYVHENEFAGGYVILDPSGTPKVRKIASNSAGWWAYSIASTIVKPGFRLDGVDGSESATGTVHIVHPGGVVLCPFTSTTAFRYVRLRIPSSNVVPDSYFTLGSICLGAVVIPGHRFSRGRSMRWLPNTRSEEDDYGVLTTRKRGPIRRQLTFSFQDLVDERRHLSSVLPNYIQPSTSSPAETADDDVLGRLAGMLVESKSGELPVTALLSIPDTSSATTITDPSLWIMGTLQGTLQGNHVIGTEGVDAVRRIESLTITEQPWDNE